MCSIQPSQDPVKDSQDALTATTVCIKCKQNIATINIRFAVYCDACFLEQTFHKFRVTVGKSRRRNDREHILLFLDTAPSRLGASLVLLGLVGEVIAEERSHVNKYSVCAFDGNVDLITEKCSKYGIPFYRLDQPLITTTTTTASQDQYCMAQMKAVAELYTKIGADKLYLADTCNDLAATVFKLMIKGNGEVVPWELQPVKRWFGMNVVRPLREHHIIEIREYNRLTNASNFTQPQPSVNHNSINDLTESFFATLDQDYSATVSTVTKTAGKVSSHWTEHQSDYLECQECACPTRNPSLCHSCSINSKELLLNK